MRAALVEVRDLSVTYPGSAIPAVEALDLSVERGTVVAVVGESGSGKSTAAFAIANLGLPAERRRGDVRIAGQAPGARGGGWHGSLGFVFQDARASFTPLARIGSQLREVLQVRERLPSDQIAARVSAALEDAGLEVTPGLLGSYPHQLSGGMIQRVGIAAALVARPAVIVADEPTSALDARSRARVLGVLRRIADQRGTAVLWVTHDLDAAHHFADAVVIMRGGRAIERGPAARVLSAPTSDYGQQLIAATPTEARGWLDRGDFDGR